MREFHYPDGDPVVVVGSERVTTTCPTTRTGATPRPQAPISPSRGTRPMWKGMGVEPSTSPPGRRRTETTDRLRYGTPTTTPPRVADRPVQNRVDSAPRPRARARSRRVGDPGMGGLIPQPPAAQRLRRRSARRVRAAALPPDHRPRGPRGGRTEPPLNPGRFTRSSATRAAEPTELARLVGDGARAGRVAIILAARHLRSDQFPDAVQTHPLASGMDARGKARTSPHPSPPIHTGTSGEGGSRQSGVRASTVIPPVGRGAQCGHEHADDRGPPSNQRGLRPAPDLQDRTCRSLPITADTRCARLIIPGSWVQAPPAPRRIAWSVASRPLRPLYGAPVRSMTGPRCGLTDDSSAPCWSVRRIPTHGRLTPCGN